MRLVRPLLLLPALLTGFLAGCAEDPFIDTGINTNTISMDKPKDTLVETGTFRICHASETPLSEVVAAAEERCGGYGLSTVQGITNRWQCRMSAPHTTHFACYDPELTDEEGNRINPFDRKAVAAWEKRTGKKAKPLTPNTDKLNTIGQPAVPAPAAQASPAASGDAPAAALPALRPEDIAGKPYPSVTTPVVTPPPAPTAPPAPVDGGFSLPQGSWGDSFER